MEGPTDDSEVRALRRRQIRNALTILLLSQGRPMLLMGDEVRRTQSGNNNAYSQDNAISWFDWAKVDEEQALFQFVSGLLRFRQAASSARIAPTGPNPAARTSYGTVSIYTNRIGGIAHTALPMSWSRPKGRMT